MVSKTLRLQMIGGVDAITKALAAVSTGAPSESCIGPLPADACETIAGQECPRDAGTSGGVADTAKG